MITRNSNSPPPPTTMLAQTVVIGPQTNIVDGEGGKLGIFWKVYELISMIVEQKMDAFGRPNSGEKINYFEWFP
jgi:hypothetical protein